MAAPTDPEVPAAEVLAIASEMYPLVKTGGLADVVGALPAALAAEGWRVTTLLPGYPSVLAGLKQARLRLEIPDLFGRPGRVLSGLAGGTAVMALDAPHLYDRPGGPYAGPDGCDWPDNALRFAALAAIGAWIARGAIAGYRPELVHAHDWQAGLTAAYLRYGGPAPPLVFTVHNLAFQGHFPAELLPTLGLPPESFGIDGVEHHGAIGYLKAGLALADRVTTVSPGYADEIRTPEGGMGLDGLLRHRGSAVSGIVNGIDTEVWNPASDGLIAATYDAGSLRRRVRNKTALQARFGLAGDAAAPLFGVVSRLSWQKGLDLLPPCLPDLIGAGAQLALLGAGEPGLEDAFRAAAHAYPGRVGCIIGYDEAVAHLMQAGADALVVPSRFEPCGLTQLCALRYGAIPVVSRVGGLADTVEDGVTGIVFSPVDVPALAGALGRAVALIGDARARNRMIRAGMARDVSWRQPAKAYAALYDGLIGRSSTPGSP